MINFSSNETVIPSLTFTKAELVYAIAFLMKDIPNSDTSTRIEMVEVRHYLNQIHDKVLLAAYNGELNCTGMETPTKPETPPETKKTGIPSIADLKEKFPTLSEDEIRAVLDKEIDDRREKEPSEKASANPQPPSFVRKTSEHLPTYSKGLTKKRIEDKENSSRFAELLGTSCSLSE